ncbi:hypothetical protein LSAT2_027565, partial [Lamellibrachia satsuma]
TCPKLSKCHRRKRGNHEGNVPHQLMNLQFPEKSSKRRRHAVADDAVETGLRL